jgi:RNA polymerase sigma factor (sigma-70 family)
MVDGRTHHSLIQVARVFRDGTFLGMPDGEVLDRFVEVHDESAFEVLVTRHGPMVLCVCRQLLSDPHDVDDAFQAVFLALVQKARSIRVDKSLGPWLYRVANRVAARTRAKRIQIGVREPSRAELPESLHLDDPDGAEIRRVVHEELGRLPERLRAPVVLCYLEGLTHDLAARQLNCPVGTVRSRLASARGLLERRLSRRGLAVAAAAVAGLLESTANAGAGSLGLPTSLVRLVTRVTCESIPRSGPGVFRPLAAVLEGATNVLPIKKLAILSAAGLCVGAAVFVLSARSKVSGQTPQAESKARSLEFDPRRLGPDGRPVGPAPATANDAIIAKTYYVGDLLERAQRAPADSKPAAPASQRGRKASDTSPDVLANGVVDDLASVAAGSKRPAMGVHPMVNYDPLLELITHSVAPGTWSVFDVQGRPVSLPVMYDKGVRVEQVGSITPFLLSISLIVRCKPVVHDELAGFLRRLRDLVDSRDAAGRDPELLTDPVPQSVAGPDPVKWRPTKATEASAKIEKLLNELRDEVKKLDRGPAGNTAGSQ